MSLVKDLFLEYVKIDTQSDENSNTYPSTEKQHKLAQLLYEQLMEFGASEVTYDKEHCYLYASIPATKGFEDLPVLGFIAHMDTAPAMTGTNVTPRIITHYDGEDIVLNEEKNIVMKVDAFKDLSSKIGKNLIVTDGTTLLGADDKAGIAEIMAMIYELTHVFDCNHGEIRIGFTPDEEIGAGADFFNLNTFHADYAYTVDGELLGEIEYENFNAAGAKVTANGLSVHPGDAKNKMINAILLLMEFQNLLPVFQNPMYTQGYEGFYHLDRISGDVEKAKAEYIIRDHDKAKFEEKKTLFIEACNFMNRKYGENTIEVKMEDSYYNMREVIEKHMHLIENAKKAMKALSIEPIIQPVRGGTDGARLSFMGLPCPNLGTGSNNCHGKFEYACIDDMEQSVELLKKIVSIYGERE